MTTLRLISWNIGLRTKAMEVLRESGCDVALLQASHLLPDNWEREHYSRGAKVIRLSERVEIMELRNVPQGRRPAADEIAVSAPGTIAAAHIVPETGDPFVAVSVYARWEKPHPRTPTSWGVGYADAMAHRAISDLSTFIGPPRPQDSPHSGRRRLQSHSRSDRFEPPGTTCTRPQRVRPARSSRIRVRRSAVPRWPEGESDASWPVRRH